MKTFVTHQQLRRWHYEKRSPDEIRAALGWSVATYRHQMREALYLRGDDDPTESEIKAACEKIQREWTDAEREQRRRGGGSAYQRLRAEAAAAGRRCRQTLPQAFDD